VSKSKRKQPKKQPKKEDGGIFVAGVIIAGVGLVAFVQGQFQSALLLIVVGLGFMAYESEKFRSELFHFFLGVLKQLWKMLSGSSSD
jgi:hypothetical protein